MTVEIKKITKHGGKRWIQYQCPECQQYSKAPTFHGEQRKQQVDCASCGARFIITWEEDDEY